MANTKATVNVNRRIEIEGFELPHVTAAHSPNGGYDLVLDRRFGIHVKTEEEFQQYAWFLANAMAVAAGFTSFGSNSSVRNDYGPSIISHNGSLVPSVTNVVNVSTPKG